MPSDTFFRLPEEKRERILCAAWQEFTAVSIAQASINRIVRAAGIPRGSFYQYFADKEDLLRYLTGCMRQYALEGYLKVLRQSEGDMFRAALAAFDGLRELQGTPIVEPIDRFLAFLRMNPGMDLPLLAAGDEDTAWLNPVWDAVCLDRLRRRSLKYMRTGFRLCLLALGETALDSLAHPDLWGENRLRLEGMLEIIQYGCLAPPYASAISGGNCE